MVSSGAAALSIRWRGDRHGSPDRCRSPLLPVDPRQAAGAEHHLRHGRLRQGGVLRVLHAEPVLPGASAAPGGRPRTLQLPEPVRDGPDPLRQSDPRHARSGRADAIPSCIRHHTGRDGAIRRDRPAARPERPSADRAGWHGVLLLNRAALSELLRPANAAMARWNTNHALLAATLVCPGHNHAVPLEPEFIIPQDGREKQDCESRAMRRWLAARGGRYARLKPVYLGDDLYSRQPTCQAMLDADANF